MLTLTLNPGFVPILAAILALAAPRAWRPPLIIASAMIAFWLLLDREFGAAAARAQMGLPVVLLNVDALNRIFGMAFMVALIAIGIASGGRRNRYEDAAILTLAGAAISALFVGDLVSFVAAASLAGLAAAWVAFASPYEGANRAGVRLLIWHGLEGLLFLVGVAFHLSAGAEGAALARLDLRTVGGGAIFAALMIRVGAPLAHVWLKDAVSHASPIGAGALTSFTTMLGVYALARLFPAEPVLVPIGAAMLGLGAFYAVSEGDARRAGAYAFAMQTGVCLALIGVGSPLALAAAEGHAFAIILAFLALQLALGGICERTGGAGAAQLSGVAKAMPMSALLLVLGGLAVSATPGFAMFATHVLALEAVSEWPLRWLWLLVSALPALTFAGLGLRFALAAYAPATVRQGGREAPFPMLLAASFMLFICIAVGMAPRWLFGLTPTELGFQAFTMDRVAPQIELLGAAGLVYLLLHVRREGDAQLLDLDAFYGGPLASLGRWAGRGFLYVSGLWQTWSARTATLLGQRVTGLVVACDQPYAQLPGAALKLLVVAGAVVLALVAR